MHKSPLSSRLVGGVAWSAIGRGLGVGCSILATVILARYLPTREMGMYFLAASVIAVASGFGQFGLGRVAIRRISETLAISTPETAKRFALTVVKLGMAAALVAAVGLHVVGMPLLAEAFPASAGLLSYRDSLALWILASIVIAVAGQIFRGFHDNRRASLVGGTFVPVSLALTYGMLPVLDLDAPLSAVMMGSAFAATVAALVSLVILRPCLSRSGPRLPYNWRNLAIDAGPFWLNSVMVLALGQADIWILSMYQPEEEVAVYGALKRLLIFSAIPVVLILPVIAPAISDLYSRKEMDTLGRVLRAAGFVGAVPLLAIVLILALAPGFWLELLFGEAYRAGAIPLVILCAGYLLAVPFGLGNSALSMTDHQHAITLITLATGGISLVAFVYAAESYGVTGIATVASVALVAQRSLCWLVLRVRYGIKSDILSLNPQQIRHVIGSALLAIRSTRGGK